MADRSLLLVRWPHWSVPSRGMGYMSGRVKAQDVAPRCLSTPDKAIADTRRQAVLTPRRVRVLAMAVGVAAVALWVLVTGGHSDLRSASAASHRAHALVTSLGSEFSVSAGHGHLVSSDSSGAHPEAFAAAVLPNSPATAVVGLGVVVAVAAAVGLCWERVMLAGRGPPVAPATALTGQDLLTRLCLSRR